MPSAALLLMLVGVKMMTHTWLREVLGSNFNLYMLAMVLPILTGGVVASLVTAKPGASSVERGS